MSSLQILDSSLRFQTNSY